MEQSKPDPTNARDTKPAPAPASLNHMDVDALRNGATASFNFYDPNIRVIGVDRMEVGHPINERTSIGYYFPWDFASRPEGKMNSGVLHLWNVYCSREQHNKLVEEFVASCKVNTSSSLATLPKGQKKLLTG